MKEPRYTVPMRHTEETLMALSHMQYDLFCQKNRIARTVIAFAAVAIGAGNLSQWWAVLLIAYGGFLLTSSYNAANHTARQLSARLKSTGSEYPSSRYLFEEDRLRVITLPNESELPSLPYSKVVRMGEDMEAFYIFQSQYGGYMIPKSELGGKDAEFRRFLEQKTGQQIYRRRSRFVALREWLRRRENEPYHL